MAAVEHLGGAGGTERLAGLNRRGVAAHRQRKIFAITASDTEGRSGAGHALRRRRLWCRLVIAKRIGEEAGLGRGRARPLFLGAAEKHVEQAFGRNTAGGQRERSRYRGGNKRRAAPHAQKSQLCTQR